MRLRRYRGLLLVALWQTAPAPVSVDSAGRIQGVLGFGRGTYEDVAVNCDGDVTRREEIPFTGMGGRLDAWPTRDLRLTVAGGGVSSEDPDWTGPYAGVQAAAERQAFGVGAGFVRLPADELHPTLYLRLGDRDGVHFRFDSFDPSPPLATVGSTRFGLGLGGGHLRRISVFGGVAICQANCDTDSQGAVFAEVSLPVHRAFDLQLAGLYGSGDRVRRDGLSVAGRVHLDRLRAPR